MRVENVEMYVITMTYGEAVQLEKIMRKEAEGTGDLPHAMSALYQQLPEGLL